MTDSSPEPSPELPPKPEPILEYNNSLGPPPAQLKGPNFAMFIAGLFSGLVVSTVADVLALVTGQGAALVVAIVLVVGGKIAVGRAMLGQPRWAPFGKGIFASIGLILLLVGACFGILGLMK
jgi:hypothetical protein